MQKLRMAAMSCVAAVTLGGFAGCQTWEGGMTLPSPHYLKDNPDYVPRAPQYPFAKELAEMQRNRAILEGAAPPPQPPVP